MKGEKNTGIEQDRLETLQMFTQRLVGKDQGSRKE